MYPNYSKAFLDLKDVFVKKVIQADSFLKVFIETKPSDQICPCCRCKTRRVHDYLIQEIDDTPFQGKTVTLVLRKRRYLCSSCGKRFLEHYSFLPSYHRRTRRLAFYVISLFRQTFSIKQVSLLTGFLSQRSVDFWIPFIIHPQIKYLRLLQLMNLKAMPLLVNISVSSLIPENTEFWISCQTALRVIWLITGEQFQETKGSKYFFVCDIWLPYVELARVFFPNAKIFVDKYHFIHQVTWAIENVRKRLQKSMPASLRKYYKRSRKLILTRYRKLKDENKQACDLMLQYSDDLRLAHMMKEWFYDISNLESYRKQQQ